MTESEERQRVFEALEGREANLSRVKDQEIDFGYHPPDFSLEGVERYRTQMVELGALLLSGVRTTITSPNDSLFQPTLQAIDDVLDYARQIKDIADAFVKENGVGSESWKSRLPQITEAVRRDSSMRLTQYLALRGLFEARRAGALIDQINLEKTRDEYLDAILFIQSTRDDVERAANSVVADTGKIVDNLAISTFTNRMNDHRTRARNLGWFSIGAAVAAVAALLAAALKDPPFVSDASSIMGRVDLIHYAIRNVLFLAGSSVVLRVLLKRYNIERHLYIIYHHRVAVSEQLNRRIESIDPGNVSARDQLRLEVLREAFADPESGYLSDGSADVNISPAISVTDSAIKRITGT